MNEEEFNEFLENNYLEDSFGLWDFIKPWKSNATLEWDDNKDQLLIRLQFVGEEDEE